MGDWAPEIRWTSAKTDNGKKTTQNSLARGGGIIEEKKVQGQGVNNSNKAHAASVDTARLDENFDTFQHKKTGAKFGKALMQGRTAKGLTQAQLAQQVAEKPSTIQQYENGKAIPNGQLISKLNKILNIKLPKVEKPKEVKENK